MAKTKKLIYKGNIPYFEGEYIIKTIIHNGEPIGNGEINNSGANMYTCIEVNQGVPGVWLFREDEVELIK